MKEIENNMYYQTGIKTSRNEDSVYAMKYASQQMMIDKLQKENQQLKKQLKELEEQSANAINKQVSRGIDLINQQKEFIEYLEEPIKLIKQGNPINITEYTSAKLDTLEEILLKYKEIIGSKK